MSRINAAAVGLAAVTALARFSRDRYRGHRPSRLGRDWLGLRQSIRGDCAEPGRQRAQSNEESMAAWRSVCVHSRRARHGWILKKGCGIRRQPSKQTPGRVDRGTERRTRSGTKIRLCLSRAGSSWRMQARPKQRIAAVRPFMTGTLRFLKTQAITRRKSVIQHQSFARSRRGQSSAFTATTYGFNRLLSFSGYRT